MEQMKRKLEELGVIGRVFDDFDPFVELILFYDSSGERAIKLGDEVTYPEVHSEPTLIEYNGDTPEYFQTFESGQSILMVCWIYVFYTVLHSFFIFLFYGLRIVLFTHS